MILFRMHRIKKGVYFVFFLFSLKIGCSNRTGRDAPEWSYSKGRFTKQQSDG